MTEIINKLRKVYNNLSTEHGFMCPVYIDIVISKRLRSQNGNIIIVYNYLRQIVNVKITMSKPLLDEFGWERFEQTFRHEIAHLADTLLYNGRNHGRSFKVLCQKFGGKMSGKKAGLLFKDCGSTDYVQTIKKWSYTCNCGVVKKMAKRMSLKKRMYRTHVCCKCRAFVCDWKEEKIA